MINALESSSFPASMRIYTSIGTEETSLMTDSWRRLTLTIAEGEDSLRVRAQLWEGESHSSVKPFAFSRGLRWIFSPPKA